MREDANKKKKNRKWVGRSERDKKLFRMKNQNKRENLQSKEGTERMYRNLLQEKKKDR